MTGFKTNTMEARLLVGKVKVLLDQEEPGTLKKLVEKMRPADVADLIEHLGVGERIAIFQLLEPENAGDVLVEIEPPVRERLLRDLDNKAISDIVTELDSDDAAVPEGLPAAATINFALGIRKMRRHNVLVRHLQAIETLGAVQTVCLDKTGTITENRMTVVACYVDFQRVEVTDRRFVADQGSIQPSKVYEIGQLASVCTLCSESRIKSRNGDGEYELSGSPTENALIHFAIRSGIEILTLREDYNLLKVNYRAENRLFMSTLHATPKGGRMLAVKGSPIDVLDLCGWHLLNGERLPLTEGERLRIETENERMAGESLRVLGVACAETRDGGLAELEGKLTWIGLVGMVDPIREGVAELIQAFHGAGIETIMITGDQSPTAYAVAEKLKLSRDDRLTILDSMEFTSVQPDVMEALVRKVHVFSRVTPAHKLQIVQALQRAGKTVAMTGDGINDAPALKAADIAIAMGHSGTDVAREVADVVLDLRH